MAHILTEPSTFDSTITVPDDGDPRNAASVNVAFQSLTNRTRALYSLRLTQPFLKQRFHSITGSPVDPTQWTTISPFQLTCGSTSAQRAYFPLTLAAGLLTDVYVVFQGGIGHGAMPANQPTAKMWVQNGNTGVATQIHGTVTDMQSVIATYEAVHAIGPAGGAGPTWGGLTENVLDATRYIIEVNTESGANAVVGDIIYGILTIQQLSSLECG